MKIFLYGPPCSGKSTSGQCLAKNLGLPFIDLDQEIETRTGVSIVELFATRGESAFRAAESEALQHLVKQPEDAVIALGAGALLDEGNRRKAQAAGNIICLTASPETLLSRLGAEEPSRPLLAGDAAERLAGLLRTRAEHYASFPTRVDTDGRSPEEAAWQAQIQAGRFRVEGMGVGYDVLVLREKLETAGSRLRGTNLEGPVALVSDENVAGCYAERVMNSLRQAHLECRPVILSAGEGSKNVRSLSRLWGAFVNARLDRKSTVLALGGGVVTDLAGFAAATYLRGIDWAAIPTSLLGMTDASLGGKTGIDLEQGKNLAGAFHAPSLVLAYPQVLASLPEVELRNGFAEVVKAGLIGDAQLFEECAQGWDALISQPMEGEVWTHLVSRAVAVKVRILREDPYEQGRRAVLNLGHTLGHAIEQASGYSLRHGEAVSIGLAIEARVGEALGVTQSGLSSRIGQVLTGLGLPIRIPARIDPEVIRRSLGMDKKRRRDHIRLPLPVTVGHAVEGFEIEEEKLWQLYWSCMDRT